VYMCVILRRCQYVDSIAQNGKMTDEWGNGKGFGSGLDLFEL
jgi:hypothetical protein